MGLSELPNADSFYSPESIECETMLNLGSIYESNKEFWSLLLDESLPE